MLFATLDPTLRAINLPHGARIILSDTVGFISDLPTMLVAAFRATLEEVIEADVVLHVRDVSHEDAEAQQHDVEDVLRQLGIDTEQSGRVIEVWNKIDRLSDADRARLFNLVARQDAQRRPVAVSALSGEGIERLIETIESRIAQNRSLLELVVDGTDGAGISWLHRNTEVLSRTDRDDGKVVMSVRVDPSKAGAVRAKFSADQSAGEGRLS
jgi:GTP-binding protein HflX